MTDAAAGLTIEQVGELANELITYVYMELRGKTVAEQQNLETRICSMRNVAILGLRQSQAGAGARLNVTVWKDGSYLYQSEGDDVYSRDDPEWLVSIPLVSAYTVGPSDDALLGKEGK